MGRATIEGGGEDGFYTAAVQYESRWADAARESLEKEIEDLEKKIEEIDEEIREIDAKIDSLMPGVSTLMAIYDATVLAARWTKPTHPEKDSGLEDFTFDGGGGGDWVKVISEVWAPDKRYTPGARVVPLRRPAGNHYLCLEEGVSGEIEPNWARGRGSFTVDNSIVWECVFGLWVTQDPDLPESGGITEFGGGSGAGTSYSMKPVEYGLMMHQPPDHEAVLKAFSYLIRALMEVKTWRDHKANYEWYRKSFKLRIQGLTRRLVEMEDVTEAGEPQSMWCADLTEDLTGEVDTIEIKGAPDQILIGPAGASGFDQNKLTNVMAMSSAQAGLAWALLPGWQKWRPTYRVGVIHSIDYGADTASVTLDPATSIAQELNVNQGETSELETIPVEYMTCDAEAFDNGDRVVVEFAGQLWEQGPKVIGFETNPQPCPGYVVLVEMGGGPGAFAVFGIREGATGLSPGQDGGANLELLGWTNLMEPATRDPLGIVGQATYRERWCSRSVPLPEGAPAGMIRAEQMVRVDQGWLAYEGDRDSEETTAIWADSFWSYEDIPYTTHWLRVDPGPPPPEVCGYTWDIAEEYGGPGEADRHGLVDLFYHERLEGHNALVYWWPPEFNQFVEVASMYNVAAGACAWKNRRDPRWNRADVEGIGILSDILLPGSMSIMRVVRDDSFRQWGGIYINVTDLTQENAFPYIEPVSREVYSYALTDAIRRSHDTGVYVYARPEWFICAHSTTAANINQTGWKINQREPADPDNLPYGSAWEEGMAVGNLFEYVQDSGDLTDRQRQIMAGNIDSYEDWEGGWSWTGPDPFYPYTYYNELWQTVEVGRTFTINCEGREYPVVALDGGESNGASLGDVGIFAKEHTGITEESRDEEGNIIEEAGNIDPDTLVPVYAWSSYIMRGGVQSIIYGMVLDGRLYKTEEFSKVGVEGYSVPGTEAAVDSGGNSVRCGTLVRIGRL
jgi:hypothetical protein